MTKPSAAIFAVLASSSVFLSPGAAQASEQLPPPAVQQIKEATRPFEVLDRMDKQSQNEVLAHLDVIGDDEAEALFRTASNKDLVDVNTRSVTASYYNDLASSAKEAAACVVSVGAINCNKAKKDADAAASTANSLYRNNGLHNGKGDAFRHCYWNARMVFSVGRTNAKVIADNHEKYHAGPPGEKRMDLHNNDAGRSYGAVARDVNAGLTMCKNAANNNTLRTSPFL